MESEFKSRQVFAWIIVTRVTFTFLCLLGLMLLIPYQRNLTHFNRCHEPIEEHESVISIIMIRGPLKLAVNFVGCSSMYLFVLTICFVQIFA